MFGNENKIQAIEARLNGISKLIAEQFGNIAHTERRVIENNEAVIKLCDKIEGLEGTLRGYAEVQRAVVKHLGLEMYQKEIPDPCYLQQKTPIVYVWDVREKINENSFK